MIIRKKSNLSTTSSSGSSCTTKNNGKVKRSIVLAETNTVHPVEHLDEMTPEEIAAIWYDPKDYAEIKASYQLTIVKMEAALEDTEGKLKFEENSEHTVRGLEYRTQTGAWARYENKRDAYNAVLDEQDRQWKIEKDDYDAISRVYMEHSIKCVQAAYQRGLEDAAIARSYCASLLERKTKSHSKKSSSSRTRSSSPTARQPKSSNHRSYQRSLSNDSKSDGDDSMATTEKSSNEKRSKEHRRVRDENGSSNHSKSSTSSSRTRSISPKKDRSLEPKTCSVSPKPRTSSSKSSSSPKPTKAIVV
jgi:hypothetical protein